ncbi:hypothetical protein OGATHE_006042 [Ogataea polymorpha]|uniref:Uncharacterized protein n=1 Tax=Ogataea polymorpha TaxID=460523 RepID=A0A9P8NU66_9ASCO|nr:hypothetical protein OGATHE_006042 [Ogataea polymorpha]
MVQRVRTSVCANGVVLGNAIATARTNNRTSLFPILVVPVKLDWMDICVTRDGSKSYLVAIDMLQTVADWLFVVLESAGMVCVHGRWLAQTAVLGNYRGWDHNMNGRLFGINFLFNRLCSYGWIRRPFIVPYLILSLIDGIVSAHILPGPWWLQLTAVLLKPTVAGYTKLAVQRKPSENNIS